MRELLYAELDPLVRDRYFTFATLREPVSRLLSAYHEISVRFDDEPVPAPVYADDVRLYAGGSCATS